MKTPPIVSPQEWDAARERLLVKEKALTRARDALAAERSPDGYPQSAPYEWWNWHDAYAAAAAGPDPKWLEIIGSAQETST